MSTTKRGKMSKTKQTVIINGRAYDATTGLAIEKSQKTIETPKQAHTGVKKQRTINDIGPNVNGILASKKPAAKTTAPRERQAAPHLTNQPQRSKTLRRETLQKPKRVRQPQAERRTPKKIERSPHISRFAKTKEVKVAPKTKQVDPELKRQAAELHQKHLNHLKKQAEPKPHISSNAIKEHLLKTQLENAPHSDELPHEIRQAGRLSRRARLMSIASTSLALVLLGGYLTYINIPNLSIRVAAANAGVDASLPRYQPNGYRIHGPIAYSSGEVQVNYQQNGGDKNYRITQRSIDWDPQATLDNYVQPDSKDNYQIHSIQGLTVYTYSNKAVWVNGGVLHIIDGDAPLTGEQVENIAASM